MPKESIKKTVRSAPRSRKTTKRKKNSVFQNIIKKILLVLGIFFLVMIGLFLIFEGWKRIENTILPVQESIANYDKMTKEASQLYDQNFQLQLLLHELCEENNEARGLAPQIDCRKYLPKVTLENEENNEESIAGIFMDFLFIFAIESQEDNELKQIIINVLQENIIEDTSIQEALLEENEPTQEQENNEKIHEDMAEENNENTIIEGDLQGIASDEGIRKYLSHYAIHFQTDDRKTYTLFKENIEIATFTEDMNHNLFIKIPLERATDLESDEEDTYITCTLQEFPEILKKAEEIKSEQDLTKKEELENYLQELKKYTNDDIQRENFLLLGRNDGNTDTIIFVSINHVDEKITLISVPRDLFVNSRKINSWNYIYGMRAFETKLEELLGQKISHYVLIDIEGFRSVIDKIGGIDYTLDEPLIDPTYKTFDNGEWGTLYYDKGRHHLNGTQALRLARSRHTSSDFSRAARQQEILKAVRQKFLTLGAVKNSIKLIPDFFEYVDTDFTPGQAAALIMKIKNYTISSGHVMSSGNILVSEMIPVGVNGLPTEPSTNNNNEGSVVQERKIYVLKPRYNNWYLLKQFVLEALQSE